jgi:hypothetical protein
MISLVTGIAFEPLEQRKSNNNTDCQAYSNACPYSLNHRDDTRTDCESNANRMQPQLK